MLVLAFDTSSATSAVALARDGQLLAEDNSPSALRHGDVLLPRIKGLLQSANVQLAQLDLLAVGLGPGSFTGLRIGLATAKGLALATAVPLRGVCSLELLARAVTEHVTTAIVVADAGKGEVFAAVYERVGELLRSVLPPQLGTPAQAAQDIAALALRNAMLCGSGARQHAASMLPVLGNSVTLAAPAFDSPQGRQVAEVGRLAWLAEGASDLASLEPTYLRGSDAKLPARPLAL